MTKRKKHVMGVDGGPPNSIPMTNATTSRKGCHGITRTGKEIPFKNSDAYKALADKIREKNR